MYHNEHVLNWDKTSCRKIPLNFSSLFQNLIYIGNLSTLLQLLILNKTYYLEIKIGLINESHQTFRPCSHFGITIFEQEEGKRGIPLYQTRHIVNSITLYHITSHSVLSYHMVSHPIKLSYQMHHLISLRCIFKQIDFIFACVCTIDSLYCNSHRWRNSVWRTKKYARDAVECVTFWSSHVMASSVIYYRQKHKKMKSICFILQ